MARARDDEKGKKRRKSIAKPRTRLAAALRRLEAAMARDPQTMGEELRGFMARFHDYSPLNRVLIGLQRPEASLVKGRKQWEAMGRPVRRGARAIFVVAPLLKPGSTGTARSFVSARLYDVADTVGAPLEVPATTRVEGDEHLVARRLRQLDAWVWGSGLELRYQRLGVNTLIDGATNGSIIWVRPDLGPAERLAVLAHEVAHVKLHFKKKERGTMVLADEQAQPRSRDVRELEAEMTSFFLLQCWGIDSGEGAAAYLNIWNASGRAVREHAERCFRAATSIVRACERGEYRKLVEPEAELAAGEGRRCANARRGYASARRRAVSLPAVAQGFGG